MNETIQEYTHSRGVALRVDREQGIIRGVKILGLRSRNGRRYRDAAVQEALPLYEGAKVNVNHPKGRQDEPRDYRDRLGAIRTVEFRKEEGLFGDFHYNPKHPLAEQLVWDATNSPENVGFSHNVSAKVKREETAMLVEEITKVQSVDLVADPATTAGLFEAEEQAEEVETTEEVTLESQLAESQQRVESLEKELASLREEADSQGRETAVRALLQEHRLTGEQASETFVETLCAVECMETVRAMVEERAQLVRSLTQGEGRPKSQSRTAIVGEVGSVDTQAFVDAIT